MKIKWKVKPCFRTERNRLKNYQPITECVADIPSRHDTCKKFKHYAWANCPFGKSKLMEIVDED